MGSTPGRHGREETEESRTGQAETVTHSEVTPDNSADPTGNPEPELRRGSPSCPLTQPAIAHEGPVAGDVALSERVPAAEGTCPAGTHS